jgi:hypothetical protein
MLGVDEGGHAAPTLGLGDHVEGERRLARGLGSEDLDHAPPWHPPHSEGGVEGEGAGGDGGHVHLLAAAQPHDRALAELLVDLRQRSLDRLRPLAPVVSHAILPFDS